MILTYIYHDCFLLKTPTANIIFDYWKNPEAIGTDLFEKLNPDVPLYVLVSHHHKDHYNPEIFQWADKFTDIHYILSRDTMRAARHYFTPGSLYNGARRVNLNCVTDLAPGGRFEDERLKIYAFGSTDIGNSYMVEIDGKKIFHAGDLNAWIWKDESSDEEIMTALSKYEQILSSIHQQTENFDLAMFPVDARLGTDFWTGAAIFVRKFNVGTFVPMHFTLADDPHKQLEYIAAAGNFKAYANPDRGRYVLLSIPGEECHIEE